MIASVSGMDHLIAKSLVLLVQVHPNHEGVISEELLGIMLSSVIKAFKKRVAYSITVIISVVAIDVSSFTSVNYYTIQKHLQYKKAKPSRKHQSCCLSCTDTYN